jgi:1-acyl-sn-glycerol-3-phosphate acyltransferase
MLSINVVKFYAVGLNRFKISGTENIPDRGGVLLLSNHISAFDTVLLPAAVLSHHPWQMVWAPAKEELFRNALLGAMFRSWGAFPVKRGRDIRAGKRLGELLRSEKVMLFPEGTRNKDGKLGRGNRGVGKLIYDYRPVVVPTTLAGINRWKAVGFRQSGSVHFGSPIDFSDLYECEDTKETHLLIVERFMKVLAAQLHHQ